MPKIQRQLSRKVGEKKYVKYVIVIPPNIIKEAGFKENEELNIKVEKKKIIIANH